jgi:putative phosphoribosyl transferase
MKYQNRQEAGKILAAHLMAYANKPDVIVLALPRGGVPVAYEIAKNLHASLDVFIVRKLGVPGHKELAMGAIASGDAHVFNEDIVRDLQISPEEIRAVMRNEKNELKRRESLYRQNKFFPSLLNKIVILVDDGIATGATARVAIKALRELQPLKLILAVPVAQNTMSTQLRQEVDEYVCPLQPDDLGAVGTWYVDFSQTEDDEVYEILRAATMRG